MTNSVVGVDIGSTSLRAVEVENPGSSHPVVVRRREVPLPAGAARAGEIIEADTVATTLKHMWSTGGFRSKKVVLGIGGQRVLARDLTVPRMSLRQIKESLPYQVQDTLPVPASEMILDFYPMSEAAGDNGPVVNGLLIAALRETVRANVKAVQLAGLSTVEVDVIPFALIRALRHDLGSTGTVAMVDVGASATSVVALADGVPQFLRIIRKGGDDLTAELVDRLGIDGALADQVKRTVDADTADLPMALSDAPGLLREFSNSLLASLRNTLAYYLGTREGVTFDRLVLTGGGAELPGFAAALQAVSGIDVVRGDPFNSIARARGLRVAASGTDHTLAVALGLALGSRA